MKNKIQLSHLIVAITLMAPLFSSAQNAKIISIKEKLMHEEESTDPYLPNAFNNKKTSPAFKFKSAKSAKITSTSITTTQVNVDATGQNISGDAGNEPSIAVNPLNPNEIVIGWRQFDNISSNFRQAGWSYTTDGGLTWTFPGDIEQGIFRSDPVLDYDATGNFYYNSLTLSGAMVFTCKVFKSTNGGASWNAGSDAGGGDKQWMAIDRTAGVGSGNIYSAWTSGYSSCLPGFFTRSTGGNSFEPCTEVDGYPALGTEAVGVSGELYIAGTDSNGNIIVSKSLNAQTPGSVITWNAPSIVNMDGYINGWTNVNPQGLLGQVNVEVDHSTGTSSGNVYVLASLGRLSTVDPADVMLSRSTDGGLTWSAPVRVNDDVSTTNTQWLGTMSVAPNGRIDAVWLDTRDATVGTDESALYYSYSTDQGTTWSVNEMLSATFDPHVGYPSQNKMGDYFDMISDNTGARLSWSGTLNGEEDVYYSRIIPPNTTGVNSIVANATISVSPNPTKGVVVIKDASIQSQLELSNTLGQKIYAAPISKSMTEINISAQPSGIYFLKIINTDGSSLVRKIVLQ